MNPTGKQLQDSEKKVGAKNKKVQDKEKVKKK